MKLYKDGIFRNTVSPTLIAELKRAGYAEVKEPVEMPAQDKPVDEKPTKPAGKKEGK